MLKLVPNTGTSLMAVPISWANTVACMHMISQSLATCYICDRKEVPHLPLSAFSETPGFPWYSAHLVRPKVLVHANDMKVIVGQGRCKSGDLKHIHNAVKTALCWVATLRESCGIPQQSTYLIAEKTGQHFHAELEANLG